MKFSHKSLLFLLVALLTVIATNFLALRHYSEKYFREYVAEVRRELPDINVDLIGAVIGAKGLDEASLEEYREVLRDLSKITTGIERFSSDPKSFVSSGTAGAFESSGRDFLSDPIARSFALSTETPVLSKILSFQAFGAETPEGIFATKVLRSMFLVNFALIALVLVASYVFIRLSMRPVANLTERVEDLAKRREFKSVQYDRRDEFRPLVEAINSLSESLSRQEKIRSDLLSDLSHEIKTPITAIKCYLEGIEDGVIPLDESNIRHLTEEIGRLIRITDSVMTMEEIEGKGSGDLKIERLEFSEILSRVREEYVPMFREAAQKVLLPVDKRFYLKFDRDALYQIVHNVFSNFRKYAGDGATLSVSLSRPRDGIAIVFSDDGAGVNEKEVPFLREKFYQAEKSRTHVPGKGAGIGLSVVEKLVRLHGGTVSVKSSEGQGFSLEIRIPKDAHQA